jgi:hypothetical protein
MTATYQVITPNGNICYIQRTIGQQSFVDGKTFKRTEEFKYNCLLYHFKINKMKLKKIDYGTCSICEKNHGILYVITSVFIPIICITCMSVFIKMRNINNKEMGEILPAQFNNKLIFSAGDITQTTIIREYGDTLICYNRETECVKLHKNTQELARKFVYIHDNYSFNHSDELYVYYAFIKKYTLIRELFGKIAPKVLEFIIC